MNDAIPSVAVKKQGGLPIVWIIPIVAVLVGGWIWWQALQEQGPVITITWDTADGLEAGKTLIKYREVEVGEVQGIELADDLSGVTVTAMMHRDGEKFLTDKTSFWVVRPRIGAGGVTGLGTLVSGAYISIDPRDDGKPVTMFKGLELPPVAPSDAPGLKLTLTADDLGSVGIGSPISHYGLQAGLVERYRLDEDGSGVEIDIYIDPGFTQEIHSASRFWNTSGISASLNSSGIAIHMDSIEALVAGGITFGTLEDPHEGQPVSAGHRFVLYDSREDATEVFTVSNKRVAYFRNSVRGLNVGAPVEFQGIKIGVVTDVQMVIDPEHQTFLTPVSMDFHPERLSFLGSAAKIPADQATQGMIDRGLRAQLATGSLVTGAMYVDLVFAPDTETTLSGDGSVLEIPTIPSTSEQLAAMLQNLPEIVTDLLDTAESVKTLVASPESKQALLDLAAVAADVRLIMDAARSRAPEMIDNADRALAAAATTLDEAQRALSDLQRMVDSDSELNVRMGASLGELEGALRSMRVLAEYLQRHPEALLSGKGDS